MVVLVGGQRLVGVTLDAVTLGVVCRPLPLPLPHLTRRGDLRPLRVTQRGPPTERRLQWSGSGMTRYA